VIARVARRLAQGLVVLLLVASAAFLLLAAAPGDPVAALQERAAFPPEVVAQLRREFGLDGSIGERYVRWLAQVAQGNLGLSVARGRPVSAVIGDALGPSLLLGGTGFLLGLLGGAWLGTWQAARAGTRRDRWLVRAQTVLVAIPDFWLALLLLLVVADAWRLLPPGGMRDPVLADGLGPAGRLLDLLRHLALPATTLALVVGARVARYQRTAVVEMLGRPFVLAARARGLDERTILWRHAARAAAGTTVALAGLYLPGAVAGTVFIERVFAWPGMGRLALDAVGARDVPLVAGITLVVAAAVIVGSMLADAAHAWLDPRLHHAEEDPT
jgi:peptide/nickel transport system permease protein